MLLALLLASTQTELLSYGGDNGYKLILTTDQKGDVLWLDVSESEIDTTQDPPTWKKPKKLKGFPRELHIGPSGVSFGKIAAQPIPGPNDKVDCYAPAEKSKGSRFKSLCLNKEKAIVIIDAGRPYAVAGYLEER